MKSALPILLALLGAGCATTGTGEALTGSWGGRHVGLVLGEAGGRLDHDCATGTIEGPLVADAAGRFAVTGTHTPAMGGPEQVGVVRPSHAARYSGQVRGDTMSLAIDVPAMSVRIGPYTLRRGVDPTLLRCL